VYRTLALLSLAAVAPAGPARAETSCAQGIQALSQQVPAVTDAHMRAVLDNDLRHARKEAAEGDEDECVDILDHANKVLKPAQ